MPELIAALPYLIGLVNLGVQALQDSQAHTAEEKQQLADEAHAALERALAAVRAAKFK